MTDGKKRILVIEDEHEISKLLVEVLSDEGYTVLLSETGEEGLETAIAEHPDLIVLDIVLPEIRGSLLLERLREDAWGKDVPVIALTNVEDKEEVTKILEHGVQDYFIKGDRTFTELIAGIKEVLGNSK